MNQLNSSREFILIDLERTLGTGMIHFWNQNKHGYTSNHTQAGKFSEEDARREVTGDFNRETVGFPVDRFQKVLKKYGEI